MRVAILCTLALTACTISIPDMPRAEACQEQADAWCDAAAPGAPGCPIVYHQWCGMGGTVNDRDQDACLGAVATMQRTWDGSYSVPDVCQRTWAR